MPRHKKKKRAAKPAASADKRDWFVGDLVVAKLRGHRPWPAQIQKPEDYGYDARPHRIFVTFFGTEETCFCSNNKITPFTSAVRKSLAEQLQKINTNPELERAIKEIFAADDELKMSSKSVGSSQKEDDEIASEKSEEEEPPVERSRKRPRAVEEAIAPVSVADQRPAKQEKTVKSMPAEQVQKLPRKVRIKVSTRGSDLPTQQVSLPESDKAGVSSSHASQTDVPKLRTSEPIHSAKTPVKNADRTTARKLDDSANLKEHKNLVVEEGDTARKHASENGGSAAETTQEGHATTGSATAKTENDGVQKMEVDDDKSVVSKTSELAVGKDDDEQSLAMKTSETAILKEDDSLKLPVTLETADEGMEKMEVDNEKLLASKTDSELMIGKEDDSSTAKESVTADDAVEKMEVDEEKAKTDTPAIEKEDEAVIGHPAGKEVEASSDSTNEPQGNECTAAATGHDPQTVEDMQTSRADQEQDAPVPKEVVVDPSRSQDSQRESGAKVEREDDGLEIKPSTSTESDVEDETKPLASKESVSASKAEDKREQKHGPQEAQMSISGTKDDPSSRTDFQDDAVPSESSSKPTDEGEKVSRSEAEGSRLMQAGAVDRIEDQDGEVEKVEHKNEAVQKVEDQRGAVKETEEQDRAVKKVEDQVTGAKTLAGEGAEVEEMEDHGTVVKNTEDQGAEVEKTVDQGTKVKKSEDQGTEVKNSEDQSTEVKKSEDKCTEVEKTEDKCTEVKKTEDQATEVKKVKGVEMKTEDQDEEVKKVEDQVPEVQATDDKDAALETIIGKNLQKAKDTPQIGSEESEVLIPASAKGDAVPQTVAEETVDSTPVQQESDTPQMGTGNGAVLSTGKQEGGTPPVGPAAVVELLTPKQDEAEEKRTDSSIEQSTTAA